ncbi:MAG TPA: bifunctional metallophosphatase/5'-nucleotidase [Flavisolibacter sp.]
MHRNALIETKNPTSRRSFLKAGSLFGLGAALAPLSSFTGSPGENTDEKLKQENDIQKITLLYTTDIHGQLLPHDEFFWENETAVYRKRGGLAHLKTMIEHFRKQQPGKTLLIDGGDYFHGSAVASLTEGEALIPIFNHLGYDLMLPGNWEVVYKKEKMLYDLGHATAAKVCANMWHDTSDENNGELIYPPYWIKNINGIKLGFIGYTDHLVPKRQSPAYSEGISFTHAEKNVAKYVHYLREMEGCNLVFLVTHMGLAQQVALSNHPAVKGVDMILGADTHERVRTPVKGTYTSVIECGAFGSFLGKIDIYLQDGKLKEFKYELLDVDPEKYPADKKMSSLIDQAYEPFKKDLQTVIGYTTAPLVRYFVLETPMDNLITDAVMWKFKPDIALSNGFRFCQPLAVDPATGKAAITRDFLWNMLPVDSEAKTGKATGSQVLDWLEKELENAFAKNFSKRFGGWFVRYAGMEVNFTIGNEMGKRVNWVRIGGEPLQQDKEYSIVACEREGDPDDTLCRMEHVKDTKRTGYFLHTVIEEYLAEKGTVSPTLQGRATATDEPNTLLTQLRGTSYAFR